MNAVSRSLAIVALGTTFAGGSLSAQTAGEARLEATILDYVGTSGTRHWTVAWVTTSSGAFIKTLWKQGPTISATHWGSHCGQWYNAKAGSTVLDGYSSATAADYGGTNSPVVLAWNGRDANNNIVADGAYKFWVQYAEDSGQGPYTTSGLLWNKGPVGATNTYPNQGANFANLRVAWIPAARVAPIITTDAPTASGTVGVPYNFACAASGTAPITFTASNLPPGLAINSAGLISGTPITAGTFAGTITAANGTLPDAALPFTVTIATIPVSISSYRLEGTALVINGSGPPNGTCRVLISTDASFAAGDWSPLATLSFDSSGQLAITNAIEAARPQQFFQLRVP